MKARPKAGFTLVELLVVIVVIGMLLGLLTAAVLAAAERTRRIRARTEGQALATSLRGYRYEYGRWPVRTSGPATSLEFTDDNYSAVFGCMSPDAEEMNPKRIPFINVSDFYTREEDGRTVSLARQLETGAGVPNGIVDPWGRPYKVTIELRADKAEVRCQTLDEGWSP